MALAIIDKYSITEGLSKPKIKIRRHLSEQEREMFVSFFVVDDLLFAETKQVLHTLCREIHERDCWIQCDCIDALDKPVFRINRSANGNLYLHRITSRAEHAPDCLFKAKVYAQAPGEIKKPKPMVKTTGVFNLMGKKIKDLNNLKNNVATTSREPGVSRSKLGRVLFHLLDNAMLNIVSADSTANFFEALTKGAESLSLGEGVPLVSYLDTNPARLKYRAMALRDDKTWPKDMEKHMLFLLHVQSFNSKSLDVIYLDGSIQTLNIAQRVYRSSGRMGERSGPYMALVLIGTDADSPWFYQPIKAFVMPSYSAKTWLPVESYYEREVMCQLFKVFYQYKNTANPIEIIKPLFDEVIQQDDGETFGVRPDFIIKTAQKRILIEVNGSHEPEYLARKAWMKELANQKTPLLSIDAYGAEQNKRLGFEIAKLMDDIKNLLNNSNY